MVVVAVGFSLLVISSALNYDNFLYAAVEENIMECFSFVKHNRLYVNVLLHVAQLFFLSIFIQGKPKKRRNEPKAEEERKIPIEYPQCMNIIYGFIYASITFYL